MKDRLADVNFLLSKWGKWAKFECNAFFLKSVVVVNVFLVVMIKLMYLKFKKALIAIYHINSLNY